MKNFMHRGRGGGGGYISPGSSDEEDDMMYGMYGHDRRDETQEQRMERHKREGERRRLRETKRNEKKTKQQEMMKTYAKQVRNNNEGFSFKVKVQLREYTLFYTQLQKLLNFSFVLYC